MFFYPSKPIQLPRPSRPVGWDSLIFGIGMAPFLVAAAGVWVFFIPVIGLYYGILPYLMIGVPLMLIWSTMFDPDATSFGFIGFVSFVILMVVLNVVLAQGWADAVDARFGIRITRKLIDLYGALGLFHAVIWCAVAGHLYQKLEGEK